MTTITAGAVTPVGAAYATSPAYSGTFIPTIWSAKLNAKFYTASTFADICNRNWEGDISNIGDKVVINNIPSLVVNDYVVGGNLQYQTPTPNTVELAVDRAKYFGFNVADVLEYQSKPDLMSMFTDDASEQMRTVIDSTCLYRTLLTAASGTEDGTVAANKGSTAGVKSAAYDLGTDTTPVDLSNATTGPNDTLMLILRMAAVLDEQNVPDSGRWLLLDPATRLKLMASDLAKAYLTGDNTSPLRNGMLGTIDRFKIYVTNHLPYKAISATVWTSGDGSETSITGSSDTTRNRLIAAGHTSAITFASQITKTEQLRNPTDFGDLVRGLQVFGHKVVKGTALATAIVTG
jgi:hypothetical protein